MKKNELINQIISELRGTTTEQEAEQKSAYLNALLTSKEFKSADDRVRDLTIKVAQGKATQAELTKAETVRDKLLQSLVPLVPKVATGHMCSKCKNTGYTKNKLCACILKEYTARLTSESGITIPLKDFKKPPTEQHGPIYKALNTYCERFPDNKLPNLFIYGGTGTGKTYAVQIIANNLLERGFSVLYTTSFALIQKFKNYISAFSESNELDAMLMCDLLIIDDLGAEPTIRNITQEYLYNVINERMVTNKPFIITTNLSPADVVNRYDQRLASRILSKEKSVIIEMKSQDLRLK